LGEILKERLESGAFRPGGLFASERELEERFGVSRTVVREALALLVADGEIFRIRGSGTFVAEPKCATPVCGLLAALLDPPVADLEVSVLACARHRGDAKVAGLLDLEGSAEILQVTSVLGRGEPLCLLDSYLPLGVLPWLAEHVSALEAGEEPPRPPVLRLSSAGGSIETTALGSFTSSLLGAKSGSPALVADLIQLGLPGRARRPRPVEFARLVFRGDRARVEFGDQAASARSTNSR
jgi:GntR family transcriptional regulator